MRIKKVSKALKCALFEESERRREAENLLSLAHEQLAEGVLREAALERHVAELEQRIVFLEVQLDEVEP